jgi:hypothetical protein
MEILMILALFAALLAFAPLDADCPDHNAACPHVSTVRLSVDAPEWLSSYPAASAAVDDFLDTARMNYLLSIAEAELDFIERELVFEATYVETFYSDDIVTLEYHVYEDLGGLYPIDYLHTLTFDLANDEQLTIEDLLTASPRAVLLPFIEPNSARQMTTLSPSVRRRWPTLLPTDTFTLMPDALVLHFPTYRQGPTHAGATPITIPLDAITPYLDRSYFP